VCEGVRRVDGLDPADDLLDVCHDTWEVHLRALVVAAVAHAS
jgi:hypothetical protein